MPSKRRISGAIAFALMILSAIGAFHHHRLDDSSHAPQFAVATEGESARNIDCVVCRALEAAPAVEAQRATPHLVVTHDVVAAIAPSVRASAFVPASPRAPPVAHA